MSDIRILLWDFGDTLCDERFIWNHGPEWLEVYQTFDQGIGAAWCRGEVEIARFAKGIANRVGLSVPAVLEHLKTSCRQVAFFPKTDDFFRTHPLPCAIVTVNPDLFSTEIVPHYQLAETCDVIVTSWEEGTLDKGELCAIALERWAEECDPSEALLIDNKQANLDAWSERGGATYLYTTDDRFAEDVGPQSNHPILGRLPAGG
ncbi:MAG: hypothetical protein AAF488_10765 [Planctomycetota bacterium]